MQQKWQKKGLLIQTSPKIEWMSSHLGPSYAILRNKRYIDIYFSSRNKKNISSIGKFTFDTKLKKKN